MLTLFLLDVLARFLEQAISGNYPVHSTDFHQFTDVVQSLAPEGQSDVVAWICEFYDERKNIVAEKGKREQLSQATIDAERAEFERQLEHDLEKWGRARALTECYLMQVRSLRELEESGQISNLDVDARLKDLEIEEAMSYDRLIDEIFNGEERNEGLQTVFGRFRGLLQGPRPF